MTSKKMDGKTRDAICAELGPKGVLLDSADMATYIVELAGLGQSSPEMVARPASTGEVAAVVTVCAEAGLPITPLGGGTGLVGGGIADGGLVLSLDRMNKIETIDAVNHTMTVQAGCVLANLQEAAAGEGCLFPLSLGSEGSCRIGGNLSTNAGGVGVLRYGNTRELVLGLEVVLADGRIWDGLSALRKDNTGYDLKQIFVGAEGTLGIITRAVVKLFPAPRTKVTAMAATDSIHKVQNLFGRVRAVCDERL
ncbi:MAG: FAD-binding oxidoreductase, partial [Rhodospirillales bacterium]|nr:FAD-binding oxidoreductase [Rhodospirillales bacterium]